MKYNENHFTEIRNVSGKRILQLTSAYTILLVEGRKPTAEYLAPVLREQGYNVTTAQTRRETLEKIRRVRPAAIVLDSPSLRFSCRRLCGTLKEKHPGSPILLLLPHEEKIDRSIGARGYLRYPFSNRKLISRVTRLLPPPTEELLKAGDIILNTKHRYVIRGNRESHLTPKQALLLEILMRHPGEVLSRAFLMKRVWDTDYLDDTRTLDVHVHWVRKAIEDDHKSPTCLCTVRGAGYCLQIPESSRDE